MSSLSPGGVLTLDGIYNSFAVRENFTQKGKLFAAFNAQERHLIWRRIENVPMPICSSNILFSSSVDLLCQSIA